VNKVIFEVISYFCRRGQENCIVHQHFLVWLWLTMCGYF
jgi:hypothetical protein